MADKLTFENIDPKKRTIIMSGLALGLLAACFDGTVTTTCGPQIAADFKSTDLLPWLTTAYLLLETVTIPLSGKLSDLYGRKKLLLIGLILFGLASLVAGLAGVFRFDGGMWVVIGARALQGAGGGILIPVATAAVSDLYAPEQRGKIQGALGALFGVGMGAGPLIGGAFAAMDMWSLAFFINLPIVIIVYLTCKGEFPSIVTEGKPVIDVKGIALISLALISIVMLFQFMGKKDGFDVISIPTLIFAVVIIGLFILFARNERKAVEPIMAPHVFSNPTIRAAAIILFLLGFTLVGDELFMGLYLQKVTDHSAVVAGLFILIMVGGMMVTSVISGMYLNKTGIKPWVIGGTLLMAIGFVLFSLITKDFNPGLFSLSELLYGMGGGCLLGSLMTAVQNSCAHEEVGMTTSAVNLLRNVGSTVGTSIFTLIVNAVIFGEATAKGHSDLADLGLGILDKLTHGADKVLDDIIKNIFTDSVGFAFLIGAVLLVIAVIVAIRFKIVTTSETKEIKASKIEAKSKKS